jgi:hypothetical protein
MKIYFAGPLFTPYERSYIDQCAKRMRDAGMQVFVPHEIPLPDPITTKFIFDTDAKEVLGANVVLTKSTKIIDVTGPEPIETNGYVPERSVVIPGSYTKKFAAGEYQVPCALIIGQRKASTDLKTSLNDALREHNVAV